VPRLLVERLPEDLATGLGRRRVDVGPLRCRVQPRTRLLLLGLQAFSRSADRGGLEYQWVCQLN
jgi:hypothetical protein